MQWVARRWQSGTGGKLAVGCIGLGGCGGLVVLLLACAAAGIFLVQRGAIQTADRAKPLAPVARVEPTNTPPIATPTVRAAATSTPRAATTVASSTARPTNTARPANTPTPAAGAKATSTAAPASASTVDPSWTVYEKPDIGFSVALPPSWKQIDMDPATLDASLKVVKEQNPEMAAALEGQARNLVLSGIKFFGFDLAPESTSAGFATNISVLKQSSPAAVALDVYVQANVGQLENLSNVTKPVNHRRARLAAGEAEELRYTMNVNASAGQSMSLRLTQYLLVKGKDAYVITLTTTAEQGDKYAPTFEKIGQSFKLTN